MLNKSELVDEVIVMLHSGNVAGGVEKLLKGCKTKPVKVAILSSMVTESLMRNNDEQTLRFFVEKLEYYHNLNVSF